MPVKKRSIGKIIMQIVWWILGILVVMMVVGYFIPKVAQWGFSGSTQFMEGQLARLDLPAERTSELHQYLDALKNYMANAAGTPMSTQQIGEYASASETLGTILKKGNIDDRDMMALRQAFAQAHIPVSMLVIQPVPEPKNKKK